jgi:nitrite reductase/ring-hydroxylating ferredoxin subunit
LLAAGTRDRRRIFQYLPIDGFPRKLGKSGLRRSDYKLELQGDGMDYFRVASINDVAAGQIIPVEASGLKLLLTKVDGQYYAAQRKCPHLGFNLCRGKLDGAAIVCPLHKAKFDLATGAIDRDPKLLFIAMKAKTDLAVYPVKLEDDDILVGV